MKRLIAVLLVFVIFLTSCGVNTPGETGGVTAHADQTAEVTDAVTEEQTEAPAATDDLSYEQPAVADGFVFTETYKEPTVVTSGTKRMRLSSKKLTFDYESAFYGSESFVKRDTHVYGFLYTRVRHAVDYPVETGYYFADFNGDRYEDMVTFENGTLKIYASSKKSNKYNESTVLYSQKLAFSGKLRGTGDFDGDGFSDLLFYT